jgi:hypothetical protein
MHTYDFPLFNKTIIFMATSDICCCSSCPGGCVYAESTLTMARSLGIFMLARELEGAGSRPLGRLQYGASGVNIL